MNEKKTWPTLYKQTATGAIQQWTISVEQDFRGFNPVGVILTEYGQVGGQLQVTPPDVVTEGKNLGKKNATTATEQAIKEAQQEWDKKLKKGYTQDLALAQSTDNVLDAIKPMLAHVYQKHAKKVFWPAFVQPKLDGMRCIAIVKNRECKLYSRSQKLITTMPHINQAIEKLAGKKDLILDGELYTHELKDDFNRIMSLAKRDDIHPDHKLIEYHIYDFPSFEGSFRHRMLALNELFAEHAVQIKYLSLVPTLEVANEEALFDQMNSFIEDGYEGAMYRAKDGKYVGKRSDELLKLKLFYDNELALEEEFKTVDVVEGRGKLKGKAGAIWCVTKDKKRFKAVMVGELPTLTDYLVNFEEKYKGKPLTVKFLNWTPAGVPRCGKGIRFRIEE